MRAFFAPEELSGRLIPASGLQKPPEGDSVPAFWAIHNGGRHCLYLVLFLAQDLYRGARRVNLYNIGRGNIRPSLLGITALLADQFGAILLSLVFEARAALRTELHCLIASFIIRKITLFINHNAEFSAVSHRSLAQQNCCYIRSCLRSPSLRKILLRTKD